MMIVITHATSIILCKDGCFAKTKFQQRKLMKGCYIIHIIITTDMNDIHTSYSIETKQNKTKTRETTKVFNILVV